MGDRPMIWSASDTSATTSSSLKMRMSKSSDPTCERLAKKGSMGGWLRVLGPVMGLRQRVEREEGWTVVGASEVVIPC